METIDFGSMLIVLDDESCSFAIGQPLSGTIKVNLKMPFDASALTLGVCGFHRAYFMPTVYSD